MSDYLILGPDGQVKEIFEEEDAQRARHKVYWYPNYMPGDTLFVRLAGDEEDKVSNDIKYIALVDENGFLQSSTGTGYQTMEQAKEECLYSHQEIILAEIGNIVRLKPNTEVEVQPVDRV